MTAMREGRVARVEELTRIPSDVQDALITILSEKSLPVPELGTEVQAVKGFTVVLPLPASEEDEVAIVSRRVAELGASLELPEVPSAAEEIRRVVTVFRELRSGVTADQRTRLKSPSGTLSGAVPGGRSRHGTAGGAAGLRPGEPENLRVLAVRGVFTGVSGADLGAAPRRAGPVL